MLQKTFTSTIFLSGDMAVKSISNHNVLDETPEDLAIKYDDFGIDQLFILDLSKNYLEHECALGVIERIVVSVDIPVIVAGCIKNKGDIERLLDMGVSKVCLNFSKESNILLAKEIKGLFPEKNLLTAITSVDDLDENVDLIEDVTSGLVLMKDSIISEVLSVSNMEMMIPIGDISLEKLIKLFEQ